VAQAERTDEGAYAAAHGFNSATHRNPDERL
jgi:hypothetical protein